MSEGIGPFDEKVMAAEREVIRRRRTVAAQRFGNTPPSEGPITDAIGVAFSGGGIRSATFNLGVMQALHRQGFLSQVDYLSTVSGGGFIGGSLSNAMRTPGTTFPFDSPPPEGSGPVEVPAVSYLRDNSNYLAPRGIVDGVRLVAVLLRGVIANLVFVVAPMLALFATLAAVIYGAEVRAELAGQTTDALRLTPWALGLVLVWILVFPFVTHVVQRIVDAPRLELRDRYERSFGLGLILVGLALVLDAQPMLITAFHAAIPDDHDTAGVTALIGLLGGLMSAPVVAFLRGHLLTVGLIVAAILGALLPSIIYLYLTHELVIGDLGTLGDIPPLMGFASIYWVPGAAIVILLVSRLVLDVNSTSMHGFYRDRLSTAYLFTGTDGMPRPAPDQPMSALNGKGTWAPYHIVNTTLNLQGEADPTLRGRRSEVFEIAPRFVGSPRTGYVPTADYERVFPELHLGSAVAISGAAAAPNMGTFTSPALVLLMGLLNVRLGVWVPNPARIAGRTRRWRPGPDYLVRELLGQLDSRSTGINITDGGHLENLGVYGLLRRRCRLVLACDAEADGGLTGQALATVIRFARLDLGVEIDIALDDIHLGEDGRSRRHVAVGRIAYPADPARGLPASEGHLIYLKSSFVGDEEPLVRDYRVKSPAFPHESTADQFFSEEQFEAYRALGDHIASSLFAPMSRNDEIDRRVKNRRALVERWAPDLAIRYAPMLAQQEAFSGLTESLACIERQLGTLEFAAYSAQIYPDLGLDPEDDMDPRARQQVQHLVNQQLQLMEDAFFSLELDLTENWDHVANRGWRNLFIRWAGARAFRDAFPHSIDTFSGNFERFCRVRLDLTRTPERGENRSRPPTDAPPARKNDDTRKE